MSVQISGETSERFKGATGRVLRIMMRPSSPKILFVRWYLDEDAEDFLSVGFYTRKNTQDFLTALSAALEGKLGSYIMGAGLRGGVSVTTIELVGNVIRMVTNYPPNDETLTFEEAVRLRDYVAKRIPR